MWGGLLTRGGLVRLVTRLVDSVRMAGRQAEWHLVADCGAPRRVHPASNKAAERQAVQRRAEKSSPQTASRLLEPRARSERPERGDAFPNDSRSADAGQIIWRSGRSLTLAVPEAEKHQFQTPMDRGSTRCPGGWLKADG